MKKKIILLILSLFIVLGLYSCDESGEYVDIKVEIVDKYTAIESKYDWFWEGFRTYTAYYLILENGEVVEVDIEEYAKHQIGDTYTTEVWVEYKEDENDK